MRAEEFYFQRFASIANNPLLETAIGDCTNPVINFYYLFTRLFRPENATTSSRHGR